MAKSAYYRTPWNYIPEHDQRETDVERWNPIEVGRCGTDSILSIGYDLRHRYEMEKWADEHGFGIEWR